MYSFRHRTRSSEAHLSAHLLPSFGGGRYGYPITSYATRVRASSHAHIVPLTLPDRTMILLLASNLIWKPLAPVARHLESLEGVMSTCALYVPWCTAGAMGIAALILASVVAFSRSRKMSSQASAASQHAVRHSRSAVRSSGPPAQLA